MRIKYRSVTSIVFVVSFILFSAAAVSAQPSVHLFSGTWSTTTDSGGGFEMILKRVTDKKFTGTFRNFDGSSTGTITGDLVDANTLHFHWSQDGGKYQGTGKFVLSGRNNFIGTYSNTNDPNNGSAGAWNGRRIKKIGKSKS